MVLMLVLVGATSVFAYEYPLSTDDIRTAYFIGNRRDITTAEFMAIHATFSGTGKWPPDRYDPVAVAVRSGRRAR